MTSLEDTLDDLYKKTGLAPYVATSRRNLDALDLSIFNGRDVVKLLEDPEARNFHEAYLVSNSLGFGNPELKMKNWVYIDCVLMQSAVIGFCLPVKDVPSGVLSLYERDPYVEIETLDYIPISGQVAGLSINGQDLIGYSLFSLRRQLDGFDIPKLGVLTKYAALKAYKADQKGRFVGLSQYDNPALKTHALFGREMRIDDVTVPLHPLRDMSFTYSMKVNFDEDRIFSGLDPEPAEEPDYLLRADDLDMKMIMQESAHTGTKFYILDPVHIKEKDGLYLPIKEESEAT